MSSPAAVKKKTKQKERQHRCIDSVSVAFKKEKKKKLQDYGFRLFTAVGFYPITLFSEGALESAAIGLAAGHVSATLHMIFG